MNETILATRRWLDVSSALLTIGAGLAAIVGLSLYAASAADLGELVRTTSWSPVTLALVATLGTALATGAGALPVLFTRDVPQRAQNALLGFSAGVMLAASMFSLILPALDTGAGLTGSKLGGGALVGAGIVLGGLLMLSMDKWLPHEHLVHGHAGPAARQVSRVWLFVFAITLHNLPEGLAVGVGFSGDDASRGVPLAFGIGIQNMPEGLAVALALMALGISRARAALVAFASGLVELVGGAIGAGIIHIAQPLLPLGLAFAAGAMLFVISHEIIPETHHHKGHETLATGGLLTGFIAMMLFDTVLG